MMMNYHYKRLASLTNWTRTQTQTLKPDPTRDKSSNDQDEEWLDFLR